MPLSILQITRPANLEHLARAQGCWVLTLTLRMLRLGTAAFGEWSEVFPNAACVVALIDRLVHHAEIIPIRGESYRHKEAQERAEAKAKKRKGARSKS